MSTHLKQLADRYLGYLLIGIFLPVTRLLGLLMKRDHSLKKPPQQILFVKILGLGSLILSSDAIREIKRKYPNTQFILLTDTNIAKGIAPFHLFDEFWTIESGDFFSVVSGSGKFLLKTWRMKNTWVIDLEVYSKLTTVFALMTFALNRFGFYLGPVFFRKYLNTHNVHFDQSAFLEDNYLRMAENVTGEKMKERIPLKQIRSDEKKKKFIALNNTCSDLAFVRKLPDALFTSVVLGILNSTSYQVVFLGAPNDREPLKKFIAETPGLVAQKERINILDTRNDFESYYHFLSEECVCLVSIDSGPLHIAKALGIPTVSVWGPTNPANYLKVVPEEENRHLYYYTNVHCSPCVHHHTELPCGGDNFCMKDMEVNLIVEKIKILLGNLNPS